MSNLSYFILTDQEKTIINQTHVDWFGYGFDAFIEYAPVSFIIIFPFILVIGILMRRIELDRTKENPEIRQPEPNAFKMISQILICSLILSILGTALTAGTIAYQKVTLAQSYAAQSYAGLRYPAEDEDTNEKLIKHGFNPQDFVQITERTETYDIVPGTLKKKAKNGEYKNVESMGEDKGSSDDWGDYKADIIVGYVGNEPKTKEYKWYSSELDDRDDNPVKYVRSSAPDQKPTLKVTYHRVEDTRFRSIPKAVDGDYSSTCSRLFYLDAGTIIRSCEYRERVEGVVPVG